MNIYTKPDFELITAYNSDIITESVPITETTVTDETSGGIWTDMTDENQSIILNGERTTNCNAVA